MSAMQQICLNLWLQKQAGTKENQRKTDQAGGRKHDFYLNVPLLIYLEFAFPVMRARRPALMPV